MPSDQEIGPVKIYSPTRGNGAWQVTWTPAGVLRQVKLGKLKEKAVVLEKKSRSTQAWRKWWSPSNHHCGGGMDSPMPEARREPSDWTADALMKGFQWYLDGNCTGDPSTRICFLALRHTWISSMLALGVHRGWIAEMAGNSPGVIRTNYKRPLPEKVAEKWFTLS